MKKKIIGWIGKSANGDFNRLKEWDNGFNLALPGVFAKKGKKSEWEFCDWPPVKVIVTIELADGMGGK